MSGRSYQAMLGSGQQTVTENGQWASDDVTVTNRFGRRAIGPTVPARAPWLSS